MSWNDDQQFEADWWGNCANTYQEETKQLVYASKMGLTALSIKGKYPVYDLKNQSVIDIGGGAVSMLLKSINVSRGYVVDPCDYPLWVRKRYEIVGINFLRFPAEVLLDNETFDEVWCYNVLQHVQDPEEVIANMKRYGKIIRLFEWIDTWVSPGHPHVLKEAKMNEWLGGKGKVEELHQQGCNGMSYYGIFLGNHYENI